MWKGAIVGFGNVAEKAHVPAWKKRSDFSIVAAADSSPKRLALAQELLPGIRLYNSLEALLKAEVQVDFVDIATPPVLHATQALTALKRNCHVLCEKPLALSRKDFETLRLEYSHKNRALFTVHNWQYAPLIQKLRELIQEGAIGALRHIELHVLRNRPAPSAASCGQEGWRTNPKTAGGGILIDHGWHQFYLLDWLLESQPSKATGILYSAPGDQVEEEATCLIQYPKASAVLHLSWRAGKREHWGLVYGSHGSIEIKDDHLIVTTSNQPPQRFVFPEPLSQDSVHPEWFGSMLQEFKSALLDPRQRRKNFSEAETCMDLLTKLYNGTSKE
jgi:predicted dehydrogenase